MEGRRGHKRLHTPQTFASLSHPANALPSPTPLFPSPNVKHALDLPSLLLGYVRSSRYTWRPRTLKLSAEEAAKLCGCDDEGGAAKKK